MKARITIYGNNELVKRSELVELQNALKDLKVKRYSDPTLWNRIKDYFNPPKQDQPPALEVKAFEEVKPESDIGG